MLDGFSLQHTLRRDRAQVPDARGGRAAGAGHRGDQDPTARRDRLVILLLYGCGLRTSELCCARCRGHQPRAPRARRAARRRAIGRASIPIPEALYTELLAYLLEHGKRGAAVSDQLPWPTDLATRMSARSSRDTVTRAGLRPGITARTLRHSFATHLMDRGVDLAVIASLMGHRSPQETGVYLHVLPQTARSRSAHPDRSEISS